MTDSSEFYPTKMGKADGEALWSEVEASLRSLYRYEGDLRYFLEHWESVREGKSASFSVPVSVTRHSKNGYDPSFDLESPEGARMTAWLSAKNVLGSGKLVLLTLKSYGRRPDAKTSFTEARLGSATPENIGDCLKPLLGYFRYLYFPESRWLCSYDSDVNDRFEFIPV